MTSATATRPEPQRELYRCGRCSYGISVVERVPRRCPMCGGCSWQPDPDQRRRAGR